MEPSFDDDCRRISFFADAVIVLGVVISLPSMLVGVAVDDVFSISSRGETAPFTASAVAPFVSLVVWVEAESVRLRKTMAWVRI